MGARRCVYTSVRTCKFATPKNQTIYQSSASNLRDYVAFGGGGDENVDLVVFLRARAQKKKNSRNEPRLFKGGYRLISADARPHLMHDFTISSIIHNFINISPIIIKLIFLDFL